MTAPKIDNRISLGNILTFAGLVFSIAVAWGIMSERADQTKGHMDELRQTLREEVATRRDAQAGLENRVRTVESNLARAEERNNAVLQVLGRIEARLERIEGR